MGNSRSARVVVGSGEQPGLQRAVRCRCSLPHCRLEAPGHERAIARRARAIAHDWMPRAVAAGLKLAANKSPEAYFGRLAVETIKASQSLLAIRSFDHFDEARRWLKNVRL